MTKSVIASEAKQSTSALIENIETKSTESTSPSEIPYIGY